MIQLLDILAARARIRAQLRPTPLIPSPRLSALLGRPVWLKPENQQVTQSFKIRGALHYVLQLPAAQRAAGLVAASAGNHGQAVAVAARFAGVPAVVCVPAYVPEAKQRAIRDLGAALEVVAGGYAAAQARAHALAAERSMAYAPAFEADPVIAGQGTIALEVLEELPDLAALLLPVGGGGLISGSGVAARGISPAIRVLGVQSDQTPAMHRSLAAGQVVPVDEPPTLCEGLAGDIDPITFAYAREVVDGMALVPEAAIGRAIAWLVREHKLVAEGSGAVSVAALLHEPARRQLFGPGAPGAGAGPVALVITGGNIDAAVLARILTEHGGEV